MATNYKKQKSFDEINADYGFKSSKKKTSKSDSNYNDNSFEGINARYGFSAPKRNVQNIPSVAPSPIIKPTQNNTNSLGKSFEGRYKPSAPKQPENAFIGPVVLSTEDYQQMYDEKVQEIANLYAKAQTANKGKEVSTYSAGLGMYGEQIKRANEVRDFLSDKLAGSKAMDEYYSDPLREASSTDLQKLYDENEQLIKEIQAKAQKEYAQGANSSESPATSYLGTYKTDLEDAIEKRYDLKKRINLAERSEYYNKGVALKEEIAKENSELDELLTQHAKLSQSVDRNIVNEVSNFEMRKTTNELVELEKTIKALSGWDDAKLKEVAEQYKYVANQDTAKATQEALYDYSQKHIGTKIASSALRTYANARDAGMSTLDAFAQQIDNRGTDKPVDLNTYYQIYANSAQTAEQAVMDSIDSQLGKDIYGTAMSMADSIITALIASATGNAIGGAASSVDVGKKIAEKIQTLTSNFIMGNSVASREFRTNIEKGYSSEDALASAILKGAVEGFTEAVSIDTILEAVKGGRTAWNLLVKPFLSEGTEELSANWLGRAVDYIFDGGEELRSAYEQNFNAAIEKGKSKKEAFFEAINNTILTEDAKTFVLGGLSGIGMGGAFYTAGAVGAGLANVEARIWDNISAYNDIRDNYANYRKNDQSKANLETLISEGLSTDKESKAYATAEKLQERVKDNKSVSVRDVRNIINEYARARNNAENNAQNTRTLTPTEASESGLNVTNEINRNASESVTQPNVANIDNTAVAEKNQRLRPTGAQIMGADGRAEPVAVNLFKDIDKGEVYISNGETKTLGQVAFDDDAQRDLYFAAMEKGYDTETANAMLQGYSDTPGYTEAFDYFYKRGTTGESFDFEGSAHSTQINSLVAHRAFALGRQKLEQNRTTAVSRQNSRTVKEADGGVYFTRDYSQKRENELSKKQKSQLKLIEEYANEHKVRVSVVASLGNRRNGMYDPNTDTITISLDARANAYIGFFSHELLHRIKAQDINSYHELLDEIINNYLSKDPKFDLEGRIREVQALYKKEAKQELSREEAIEEIVANSVIPALSDKQFIESIVENKKTLAEKISEWVNELINELNKILDRLSNIAEVREVRKDVQLLENIRNIIDESVSKTGGIREAQGESRNTINELDSEYMAAVESGNVAEQQRLVEEAARRANFNSPRLYHGTDSFGFTKVDTSANHGDGISFWASNKEETSGTYATVPRVRQINQQYDDSIVEETIEQIDSDIHEKGDVFDERFADRERFNWFDENYWERKRVHDINNKLVKNGRKQSNNGRIYSEDVESQKDGNKRRDSESSFENNKGRSKEKLSINDPDLAEIEAEVESKAEETEKIRKVADSSFESLLTIKDLNPTEQQKKRLNVFLETERYLAMIDKNIAKLTAQRDAELDGNKATEISKKLNERYRERVEWNKRYNERLAEPEIQELIKKSVNIQLAQLIEEYGSIKPGFNPVREIAVPKRTSPNKKVRQTVRTILESGAITDDIIPDISKEVLNETFSYVPVSDEEAKNYAEKYLEKYGYEAGMQAWESVLRGDKRVTKNDIALAEYLLQQAAQDGNVKDVLKLSAELSAEGTRAGQTAQAISLLKKLGTPEVQHLGQLYYIQKAVDNLNKDIETQFKKKITKGKVSKVKIDEALAEDLLNAETEEEYNSTVDKIIKDVADQMPSTWIDKWNAWRYLAMLGNVRTHTRNIVGNALFVPAIEAKNFAASLIEKGFVKKGNKTKSIVVDKAYRDFASDDFAKVKDYITSGSRYDELGTSGNITTRIKENKKVFNTKWLETARKTNSRFLENEDIWFLSYHYKRALSQYLQANHAAIEGLTEGSVMLEKARAYAIQEAQKATYRDFSATAQAINQIANRSSAARFALNSILPFRSTPINILKRGIEYSPMGLATTLGRAWKQYQAGVFSSTDLIDGLSAGFVGTAAMSMGALLYILGVVQPGYDDDEEQKFDELQGGQEYSLKIGDVTYTFDWAAPMSLPFFLGAQFGQVLRDEDGLEAKEIFDIFSTITEPMFELSMLEGLNSTIEAVSYEGQNKLAAIGLSLPSSYLQQAVPTMFGQVARIFDSKTRSTYIDKNSPLPDEVQRFYQQVIAKVPFVATTKNPYINAWGEEKKESILFRILENTISPGYFETYDTNDVEKELKGLYEATNEKSVLPKNAQKYFNVNKERKDLTSKEYVAFASARGQTAYETLTDLFNVSAYNKLTDEQRVDAVENAYLYANEKAKMSISSDYTVSEKWIIEAEEAYERSGLPIEMVILSKALTADITSDKDKDGNTISGSKKEKVLKSINSMDLTRKQKDELYYIYGYGKKDIDKAPWN